MALTEVSAFKDLSIINEDINGSAAIAGSKINPSFGNQNIFTNGNLNIQGGLFTLGGSTPAIQFTDNEDNPDYRLVNSNGEFRIRDNTAGLNRIIVHTDGHVDITSNLDCLSGLDVTGDISCSGTVDGVDIAARDTLFGGLTSSSGVLTNGVTATTQSASDNSTKIATTAYVDAASGGGSASQLTDTNGTVKVEVDTSTIFLKDTVHIRDSLPTIHFKSSDGNTNYGWFRSFSASTEIFNRVSGGETKFKVQAGGSTINKILIRNTSGGTQTNPDVCIGRSMVASGKPTDLNAFFPHTGGVELYHISGSTGTKKFETTANGITVQGSVTTEDINMSNLNASANEVDNTKGSWTIQEGASDLFLINRVNGKKYKFNLTEIS